MATKEDKYEDNAAGKYYCDTECIDCDLCRETAPENFTRNDDGGYSFLYKQPENEEEEALCQEAMEGCLLYTSPSPRDKRQSRMPSSA